MKKIIIDAEKSDLFDVLAHVAYALEPLTREQRAARAKAQVGTHYNNKQRAFRSICISSRAARDGWCLYI